MSYPFMWRDQPWNSSGEFEGVPRRQLAIDIVMTTVLILSILAVILRGTKQNQFAGFDRNLQVPYLHRQKVFFFIAGYYLLMGIQEVAICLSEKQVNTDQKEVSWVWPPDGIQPFCSARKGELLMVYRW